MVGDLGDFRVRENGIGELPKNVYALRAFLRPNWRIFRANKAFFSDSGGANRAGGDYPAAAFFLKRSRRTDGRALNGRFVLKLKNDNAK